MMSSIYFLSKTTKTNQKKLAWFVFWFYCLLLKQYVRKWIIAVMVYYTDATMSISLSHPAGLTLLQPAKYFLQSVLFIMFNWQMRWLISLCINYFPSVFPVREARTAMANEKLRLTMAITTLGSLSNPHAPCQIWKTHTLGINLTKSWASKTLHWVSVQNF